MHTVCQGRHCGLHADCLRGSRAAWPCPNLDLSGPQSLVLKAEDGVHSYFTFIALRMVQVPDKYPHWMQKQDKESEHSDKVLGQMYDRVQQHPINKQLQEQELVQANDPKQHVQQLRQQAAAIADAWVQRLQGWPLLLDAFVLQPRVQEILADFDADITGLKNVWHVHDAGKQRRGAYAYWPIAFAASWLSVVTSSERRCPYGSAMAHAVVAKVTCATMSS